MGPGSTRGPMALVVVDDVAVAVVVVVVVVVMMRIKRINWVESYFGHTATW